MYIGFNNRTKQSRKHSVSFNGGKNMDNENKNTLSEKQLAQVSGGVIPDFPCSYGEQVCPVCGSTDVQYAYTDIGYEDGVDQVQSEVWICHSCNNHFVRIAFYT